MNRPPIYCTGGCDACRDAARELGVALIVPAPPLPEAERLRAAELIHAARRGAPQSMEWTDHALADCINRDDWLAKAHDVLVEMAR